MRLSVEMQIRSDIDWDGKILQPEETVLGKICKPTAYYAKVSHVVMKMLMITVSSSGPS